MSLGSTNITADFRERQYSAYHEQTPVPSWFRPILPTYSGPTLIVYPDTLNQLEQAEVNAWLYATTTGQRTQALARCTLRGAIAKITEYVAYYADPSYLAWADACVSSTISQWRLYLADAIINSKAAVPASMDVAGTGSAAVTIPYTAPDNVS